MPTPPLSDDDILWAVNAVNQYGGEAQAAKALNVDRNKIRSRVKRAAEKGMIATAPVMPGYVIKSVSSKEADGTWIKQTKEPGEVFELPSNHRVSGISALTDSEGRVVQKWTKTKSEPDPLAIAEAVKAAFIGWEPRSTAKATPICDEDLATLILAPDVHLGQMSW